MKIIITTSTLPATDDDKVPAFVKDQAIHLAKNYPDTQITIHAPHNHYSKTSQLKLRSHSYKEVRFHYFWPKRLEVLAGRGIMPALSQNKILYFQIPFLFLFQFTSLLKLVKKDRPDLLYAHWFTPQAITTALVSKFTNTPFVFTTHASDAIVWHKVPFGNRIVRWVCSKASSYTAVSETTAKKLQTFFNETEWTNNFSKKLSIIPMGVEVNIPELKSKTIDATVKKYSIPKNKKIILFLGRLAEKKGVTYLLEAYSKLEKKERKQTHLVVAGDGQLLQELKRQATKLEINEITFTGYVSGLDKDALFAIADYVCLPSIIDSKGDQEGFPVVLMEALAAGKIVLASDASGAELVLRNGVNGYVFKQKSSSSLLNTLHASIQLSDRVKAEIVKESKKLSQSYSWDKINSRHYKEIFNGIGNA